MKRTYHGGYVGLVALLVSVTIVALLFAKLYLTPRAQSPEAALVQPLSASGSAPETDIGRMHADVDAASALRDKLNAQNKETNAAMGE